MEMKTVVPMKTKSIGLEKLKVISCSKISLWVRYHTSDKTNLEEFCKFLSFVH